MQQNMTQDIPTSISKSGHTFNGNLSDDSRTNKILNKGVNTIERPHQESAKENPKENSDPLVRIFNTAVVATQMGKKRDFSRELFDLTESIAFKAILNSVRHLSKVQGITERQAAEDVINTFRKIDELWGEYMFREGLDKLRNPK